MNQFQKLLRLRSHEAWQECLNEVSDFIIQETPEDTFQELSINIQKHLQVLAELKKLFETPDWFDWDEFNLN